MKKPVLSFLIFFLVCSAFAQTPSLPAFKKAAVKYYKVKMEGDASLASQLLKLGVTIDHAEVSGGCITSEISEQELALVKQSNIKHTVLINDMAAYYETRILNEYSNKTSAAGVCNAPNINKPTWFHLGSMGGYFTLAQMEVILDSMKLLYPSLITAKQPISTTKSIEGRDIWFVKISDNPNIDENEPELMYNALHHAREAASLSQTIFYMWYMLENYTTNPDIKFLVDNTEMYFVPCVNPDGYFYNQTTNPNGGGMWRKNRRVNGGGTFGVDLNRNYGYNWGYDNTGSSPTSSSDTYRGTAAFSEPETKAMRDFCNAHQFKTSLNAHTYSNLLIYPWGYLPSYYTPDSATFVNWSVHLTETSRFLYGTGDQTVNYVTNGDADDWMYGEQGTKPKILSLTPEAGAAGDGFWPPSSRILDICKTTFNQNLILAKLVTNYGLVRDEQDRFISSNGYIKYGIQRLGLENGSFTVSVVPVGAGITGTGSPKVYSSLTQNQNVIDSISFTLTGFLNQGQLLQYALAVDNGFYVHYDTITKMYGTPVIVLNDPCNAISNWNPGGWSNSTTKFKSAPGSITDSPSGSYASNSNKSVTLLNSLNLGGATYAHLQYYTRFQLEKNYDKVQIFGSTNGGSSWSPICAKYETSPASFGGTNPMYDGLQDGWVKEEIDLSTYIGQNLLIRFTLTSDNFDNQDGFYFDDFLVRKIAATFTGMAPVSVDGSLLLYPNPNGGNLTFKNTSGINYKINIFNNLGQEVYRAFQLDGIQQEQTIDLGYLSNGIYFVKVSNGSESFTRKVILNK